MYRKALVDASEEVQASAAAIGRVFTAAELAAADGYVLNMNMVVGFTLAFLPS